MITKEVSRLNDVCYANKHKFTKLATNFTLNKGKQIKPQNRIIKNKRKIEILPLPFTLTHTHTWPHGKSVNAQR